ncbi:unnamed protein product [Linum perenne]
MAHQNILFSSVSLIVMLLAMNIGVSASKPPKTYIVGDEDGWDLTNDMEAWPQGKTFYAGDTLVFKYDLQYHNVVVTDQVGHDTCTVTKNSKIYDSEDDHIQLRYGQNFFISSLNNDCPAGMKMAIFAKSRPRVL